MGYYFDEWKINFEALKKKVSQGISPTVFIKFSDEDPELNLRKGQVPQDPIFDNGIDNKIVYFIMHEDKNDFGDIKPKTIGKLLDEKVCIEGMFTIALRCMTDNNKHYFKTQSDGSDICKTPLEMFADKEIDNDLKLVDTTIREYYELNKEDK